MAELALPTAQALAMKRFQDQRLTFYFATVPGSIAGLTFTFTLKRKRGEQFDAIIEEELEIDDDTPAANVTCAHLDLTADDTDLSPGTYCWDVRTQEVGDRAVYAHGTFVWEGTAAH